jgi:hypothetical protein
LQSVEAIASSQLRELANASFKFILIFIPSKIAYKPSSPEPKGKFRLPQALAQASPITVTDIDEILDFF